MGLPWSMGPVLVKEVENGNTALTVLQASCKRDFKHCATTEPRQTLKTPAGQCWYTLGAQTRTTILTRVRGGPVMGLHSSAQSTYHRSQRFQNLLYPSSASPQTPTADRAPHGPSRRCTLGRCRDSRRHRQVCTCQGHTPSYHCHGITMAWSGLNPLRGDRAESGRDSGPWGRPCHYVQSSALPGTWAQLPHWGGSLYQHARRVEDASNTLTYPCRGMDPSDRHFVQYPLPRSQSQDTSSTGFLSHPSRPQVTTKG